MKVEAGRPNFTAGSAKALEATVRRSGPVREGLDASVAIGAQEARRIALSEAHDDGTYERSIVGVVVETPQGPEGRLRAGGRRAFYAHIIEWGGARRPARAILRRGAARIPGGRPV